MSEDNSRGIRYTASEHNDHGGSLIFTYPKLPLGTDFETFRVDDPEWKKMVQWFNEPMHESIIKDQAAKGGNSKESTSDAKDEESSEKGDDDDGTDFSTSDGVLGKRNRFVLLQWPRDPNGKKIAFTPEGKMTSNGLPIWGATLYDFYRVYRDPGNPHLSLISSGSRLAAWMKENGEADYAKNQMKQAQLEPEPMQLPPYHIEKLVELIESQVHREKTGKSLKVDKSVRETTPDFLKPPSEYPGRWPLRPFSTPTFRFQQRLPMSYLPKKLIVHDPWNCLMTGSRNAATKNLSRKELRWGSRKDNIYVYNLQLSEAGKKQQNIVSSFPLPDDFAVTKEAHLYITPKRKIGSGHHSFVYQVELELPRPLLVHSKPCEKCSFNNIVNDVVLKKGKSSEDQDHHAEFAAKIHYSNSFKGGQPFSAEDENDVRFKSLKHIKWMDAPYCEHLDDGVPRPPSAKVSVTAKLTIPDDGYESHSIHLRDEARSYQEFPRHFYEHWTGYNVIPPIMDPVPVGAVVPQFYGYYVPDESNEPKRNGQFMSPILLLEHCGVQVDIKKLPLEARRECLTLLKRFNHGGFVHNSVYERNFMLQSGPLHLPPFERNGKHPRYRLIDFGRTKKADERGAGALEEYSSANKNLELQMY